MLASRQPLASGLSRLATRLSARLAAWPIDSQQVARRNALVACTALTQLRIERDEIAAYVNAAAARHQSHSRRPA